MPSESGNLLERILTLSDLRAAISQLISRIRIDQTLLYEIAGMLGIMAAIAGILYIIMRRAAGQRIIVPVPAAGPEAESERPIETIELSRDEQAVLDYLVQRTEGSVEDMTAELGLSSETVSRSLDRLSELGFIKRTSRSVLIDERGLRYLSWLQERTFDRRREKRRPRET